MTITPTLAAALRDATVEQLREDAKLMEAMVATRLGGIPGLDMWCESWTRLAALALAVATMQERGDARVEQDLTGRDYLCTDTPIQTVRRTGDETPTRVIDYGGCDLLPALSALLEDE